MQKQNEINHFPEIFLSSAVLVVLTEIAHWMIRNSDKPYIINKAWFFGTIGGNVFSAVIGISLLLLAYLYLRKNFVPQIAIILFFSGAITNLIDRSRYGGTIDYLNLLNIPTFNLADIFIVTGVIIFLVEVLLVFPRRHR